ncbi:anti-sigma factor family protein [Acidicapsa acidisoli]|uniref:anti-sigma factor family protein n=1 Tax=Acidicapsa acidisoli TaxID=1615681 RepID=UPI0021DF6499|nr:zf-HC2 domain-containing protein [Acidicapsa acidisoli]
MAEKIKDRANIPNSPACGLWETLLVDAMDGLLRPEDEAIFSSHMATCASCAEMFEQVRRGREWLEFLAPEPEVPAHLLDRILVETGHGKLDSRKLDPGKLILAGGPASGLGASGNVLTMTPVWQRPGFGARMRRFAEPRLLMTAAMAFFSIALTLSMTGVRISSFKMADLRPASVRSLLEKRIMTASTPIIRYYDHLRFVYEVESRMRELRRSTETDQQSQPADQNKTQPSAPAPAGSGGDGQTHRKDGGSKLNPNAAPQQTVNPPAPLWSGDTIVAQLETGLLPQPGILATSQEADLKSKGLTTHREVSSATGTETVVAGSIAKHVLAMPEWSISCIA